LIDKGTLKDVKMADSYNEKEPTPHRRVDSMLFDEIKIYDFLLPHIYV